jgi:ribosomal protein S18 acetylase RimI-like enzyme
MFGPVGTHPAHRRRSLAKALMYEGLRRLKALKINLAYVDCDLDLAANRLYESAGFTSFDRVFHWQKAF